jgi:hypothetical protein
MRSFLRRAAVLLVLLLAVAGHVLYWYAPRERAAAPDPEDLPARLFSSGAYDTCLWLPYPHQNLGALAGAVEDFPGFVAAAARLGGARAPEMPGFGPFAVPPAREVAACGDRASRRYQVAARIYPGLALVAKAAGTVAGNPWLAGGPVPDERVTVRWEGSLWTVTSGAPGAVAEQPAEAWPAALAAARLAEPESALPAGFYLLERQSGALVLGLAARPGGGLAGAPAPPTLELTEPRPVLLAAAGPGIDPAGRVLPPAALFLFSHDTGGSLKLPGAALLQPPGAERWSLPGGGLADLVAGHLPRGNAAGWEIVAIDRSSLRQAERLAGPLARLLAPGQPAAATLRLGLWLEPAPAHALASRTRTFLEQFPLVERREVERWRDAETLLAPLAACRQVVAAAGAVPPSFRLELRGCRGRR